MADFDYSAFDDERAKRLNQSKTKFDYSIFDDERAKRLNQGEKLSSDGLMPIPDTRNAFTPTGGTDRTIGEAVKDTALKAGQGVKNAANFFGGIVNTATGNTEALERRAQNSEIIDAMIESRLSPGYKAMEAERQKEIDDAEGILGKGYQAAKGTLKRPGLAVGELASTLPHFATPMVGAKAASVAAKALNASSKVVTGAKTAAFVGTSAAQQGTDVSTETYSRLLKQDQSLWDDNADYQAKIQAGISPLEAKREVALNLARRAGVESAAVSLGTNILPQARLFERALAGNKVSGGKLGNLVKSGAIEAASEAVEEGYGQFSGNRAVQSINPKQLLSEGVGQAGGQAAVLGGVFGGLVAGKQSDGRTSEQIKASKELNSIKETAPGALIDPENAAVVRSMPQPSKGTPPSVQEFVETERTVADPNTPENVLNSEITQAGTPGAYTSSSIAPAQGGGGLTGSLDSQMDQTIAPNNQALIEALEKSPDKKAKKWVKDLQSKVYEDFDSKELNQLLNTATVATVVDINKRSKKFKEAKAYIKNWFKEANIAAAPVDVASAQPPDQSMAEQEPADTSVGGEAIHYNADNSIEQEVVPSADTPPQITPDQRANPKLQRPYDIVGSKAPFQTEAGAKSVHTKRGLGEEYEITPIDGGFALRKAEVEPKSKKINVKKQSDVGVAPIKTTDQEPATDSVVQSDTPVSVPNANIEQATEEENQATFKQQENKANEIEQKSTKRTIRGRSEGGISNEPSKTAQPDIMPDTGRVEPGLPTNEQGVSKRDELAEPAPILPDKARRATGETVTSDVPDLGNNKNVPLKNRTKKPDTKTREGALLSVSKEDSLYKMRQKLNKIEAKNAGKNIKPFGITGDELQKAFNAKDDIKFSRPLDPKNTKSSFSDVFARSAPRKPLKMPLKKLNHLEDSVSQINESLAQYHGDKKWRQAYSLDKDMPNKEREAASSIGNVFGKEVVFMKPNSSEFKVFNGIYISKQDNKIFVDSTANVSAVQVVGHELTHALRRDRPDIYKWYEQESRKYLKDMQVYQKNLNANIKKGEPYYNRDRATEELLGDFSGDAIADPKFLQQMANDNPGKFKTFARKTINFLSSALNKMRSLNSNQHVADVESLRGRLREALDFYAEGKPIKFKGSEDYQFVDENNAPVFMRRGNTPFEKPIENRISAFLRKIQDRYHTLKILQQNIKKAGGNIDNENDAYQAETLAHGKTEDDLDKMTETYVKPFADRLSKYNIKQSQIDEFMIAMHAKERNEKVAKERSDMPDNGSGMSTQEAKDILQRIRASGKFNEYMHTAKPIYEMLQQRRNLFVEGSLEEQGLIDAYQKSYKHYIPLKGYATDEQSDAPRVGSGLNIFGRESMRKMGRTSRSASPSSQAIMDMSETHARHRQNEVGNSFLKLVQDNPNPEYWEVFDEDVNPEYAESHRKGKVQKEKVPLSIVSKNKRAPYFRTKKDGKTYYVKIKDPRLLKAMNNLDPDGQGVIIRSMGAYTRVLSTFNTSLNPAFTLSNFIRDVPTALFNLSAEQTRDDGKIKGNKIIGKTIRDIFPAMNGIIQYQIGNRDGKWAKAYGQFKADGAKTGWYDMKDRAGMTKDITRLIRIADGGIKGNAMHFGLSVKGFITGANNAVENAVRLSAYHNAVNSNVSRSKAASLAKDMTVNFNRKGEIGANLNALYMFSNASIQGVANFMRSIKGLNGDGKLRLRNMNNAQKIAGAVVGGAVSLAQYNRIAAGEDDDGVNWYDKINSAIKERNVIIMKPGRNDGSYHKIPLPYGFNVFHVLGTEIEALSSGSSDLAKTVMNMTAATFGSFSPIGFSESNTATGFVLKNAVPTIGKSFVEIGLNEDFFKSPIHKVNWPGSAEKAKSAMSFRSTPEAYKWLAKQLNDVVGGGSDYRPGRVGPISTDFSPDDMEHVVNSLLGGASKFFLSDVVSTAEGLAEGTEIPVSKRPFLNRFQGQVTPYADQGIFYDRGKEIRRIRKEAQTLKGDARRVFLQKHGKPLQLKRHHDSTSKLLKNFRDRRDKIEKLNIPPTERERRINEIELSMKKQIDRFNKRYNELIK